jgi:hypothetical protein
LREAVPSETGTCSGRKSEAISSPHRKARRGSERGVEEEDGLGYVDVGERGGRGGRGVKDLARGGRGRGGSTVIVLRVRCRVRNGGRVKVPERIRLVEQHSLRRPSRLCFRSFDIAFDQRSRQVRVCSMRRCRGRSNSRRSRRFCFGFFEGGVGSGGGELALMGRLRMWFRLRRRVGEGQGVGVRVVPHRPTAGND